MPTRRRTAEIACASRVVRSATPAAAVVSDDPVKLTDVSEEISELISEVGERYGIGSLFTARRLIGGYANDVFRLDADGPPTVSTLGTHRSTPTA